MVVVTMAKSDQHILIDSSVLQRIVEYADLSSSDVVLEIGAGTGVLTEKLSERVSRVIAIEIDPGYVGVLNRRFRDSNVEIVNGDALKVEFPAFNKVVSNLPYSISSEITFRLLAHTSGHSGRFDPFEPSDPFDQFEPSEPFERAVLMYQYEFAERMAAPPGSKAYGRLSIAVQYRAEIELIEVVPATAFAPQPTVQSAIVRLTPRAPEYELLDPRFFSRFLTAVFSQRRKKLKNSIAGFVAGFAGFSGFAELSVVRLEDVGLPADILEKRPEELSAAALAEIANSIYSRMRN